MSKSHLSHSGCEVNKGFTEKLMAELRPEGFKALASLEEKVAWEDRILGDV